MKLLAKYFRIVSIDGQHAGPGFFLSRFYLAASSKVSESIWSKIANPGPFMAKLNHSKDTFEL
jgi:hypothetical protein